MFTYRRKAKWSLFPAGFYPNSAWPSTRQLLLGDDPTPCASPPQTDSNACGGRSLMFDARRAAFVAAGRLSNAAGRREAQGVG